MTLKIVAFKILENHLPIEPASNRRQWMDETAHSYAYRCLPLQIANANGWVLRSPSDFYVTWTGTNHKSALTVHFDGPTWEFAVSSFGHGIVTFHTGLLFKTISEERYDLLVGGYPNYFFDFMSPLTGIVETWWNDTTFTMNWKLNRPGTFKINKGEPIVYITPVPHELPPIETELVALSSDHDMLRKFNAWSQKRNQTIGALDEMENTGKASNGLDPNNPSTHWEKTYTRGMSQDGEKIDGHITKRKFPKFDNRKR